MTKKKPVDKGDRKITTRGEVSRNKKGGYNSETYEPQSQKEFGAVDSIKEIGRLFRGKR